MATLDLKPLTQQTIEQLGLKDQDLWLVQIKEDVFGPFETESLKHFASENENQFETALASRVSEVNFQPFWGHALFQRRAPQAVPEKSPGPFWLLQNGLKTGPLSFQDIDKKIELGILGMSDHISTDDGHSWKKIYEISGLDRRSHSPSELPQSPLESSFQKAKLVLAEKLGHIHESSEDLADMAYHENQQAKVIQFKVEEASLSPVSSTTEISQSLKWFIPGAAACLVAVVTTGYFMLRPGEESPLVSDAEVVRPELKKRSRPVPQGVTPSYERSPASVGYGSAPNYNNYSNESRYPTHIETHEPVDDYGNQYQDPVDVPVGGNDNPESQEHSLVENTQPADDGQSLDAAMNGVEQPAEAPIVEEASDF